MDLSVVVPVYKADGNLSELLSRIQKSLGAQGLKYEVLLINDGCPYGSWSEILQVKSQYAVVKAVNLSRNFGQHYAISAGLANAAGDWVVVMDCDLQDQPEEIPKLLKTALDKKVDIVFAQRKMRQDSFLKKMYSKIFYALLRELTGTEQDASIGNFGVYSKRCVQALNNFNEVFRYLPVMVRWLGFKNTKIEVEHAPRSKGESSYNFIKGLRLALNVIIAFSDKPLRLLMLGGLGLSVLSIFFGIYILWQHIQGDILVPGWTSLIVSIWFLGGVLLFAIGFVGLYLGKTLQEAKKRPLYIIDEILE